MHKTLTSLALRLKEFDHNIIRPYASLQRSMSSHHPLSDVKTLKGHLSYRVSLPMPKTYQVHV